LVNLVSNSSLEGVNWFGFFAKKPNQFAPSHLKQQFR